MGLAVIPYLPEILENRNQQSIFYKELLKGLNVSFLETSNLKSYNYAYFPIMFTEVDKLLNSKETLENYGVFTRRYFYPGMNNLDYTTRECPVSDSISLRILCLPIYHTVSKSEQKMIARLLLMAQSN